MRVSQLILACSLNTYLGDWDSRIAKNSRSARLLSDNQTSKVAESNSVSETTINWT